MGSGYEYYQGYLLDTSQSWQLSTKETSLLDACIWMVDNKSTIRTTASNCGYTKSTLHRLIHLKLKRISYELYRCIIAQMRANKKNAFRRIR